MSSTSEPQNREHATEVRWQSAWGEWRATCDCGWVGSYWAFKPNALAEADKHEREALGDNR